MSRDYKEEKTVMRGGGLITSCKHGSRGDYGEEQGERFGCTGSYGLKIEYEVSHAS